MREIVGAIIILAGSVLVAAGIIADSIGKGTATTGYTIGAILAIFGFAILVFGPAMRAWDAIPVDQKKSNVPQPGRTSESH